MIKLSHDSYLQGALDFLKTASIDSDIGRTALEVLIKESKSMPSLAAMSGMTGAEIAASSGGGPTQGEVLLAERRGLEKQLAAEQSALAEARAALEAEQRALATAGQETNLYKKLHRAAEADLKDAVARGKKLKGKALGLGGLATLGLGYMGYDQLAGGEFGAPTPPPAPEPGFLQRMGLAS